MADRMPPRYMYRARRGAEGHAEGPRPWAETCPPVRPSFMASGLGGGAVHYGLRRQHRLFRKHWSLIRQASRFSAPVLGSDLVGYVADTRAEAAKGSAQRTGMSDPSLLNVSAERFDHGGDHAHHHPAIDLLDPQGAAYPVDTFLHPDHANAIV